MSVTLSPSGTLGFQRPLTQLVKRTLSVTNASNSNAVAYKVKTTAPKQYCVRPNSGRIEPGETVEVHVLLQPMKEDPAPGAKCRDKFLVQSVVITPDRESVPLPELWKRLEDAEKARTDGGPSEIHEQKIRCTYLPAAEADVTHSAIPEEAAASDADASRVNNAADASFVSTAGTTSRAPDSPAPASPMSTSTPPPAHADAVEKARDGKTAEPAAVPGKIVTENASNSTALGAAVSSPTATTTTTTTTKPAPAPQKVVAASTPKTTVASTVPTTTPVTASTESKTSTHSETKPSPEEFAKLRRDLDAARDEIVRLKQQLDGAETTNASLRSRGAGAGGSNIPNKTGAGTTSQAIVDMKGQEGVPVQVVAGIAFGVFVVTWLFF